MSGMNRRTFVGTAALAVGAAGALPLAGVVRAARQKCAGASWSLDELGYSYPLYAEAIPYARAPLRPATAGAAPGDDPLEQLLVA